MSILFDAVNEIATRTGLIIPGNLTAMGFFKTGTTTSNQTILHVHVDGTPATRIQAAFTGGVIRLRTTSLTLDSGSYSLNKWYALALRRIGTKYELWADAKLILQGEDTSSTFTAISIGNYNSSPQYPAQGMIAGVKLWNEALTPEDIYKESLFTRAVRKRNLIGDWPLTDATTVRDFSGFQNTLTVSGSPTTDINPPIRWLPPPRSNAIKPATSGGYIPIATLVRNANYVIQTRL